ncbi:hypothetical protein ASPCADRAFT_409401 [Aspergillus carbonarius ITEM 5010]|uniref:Uncharacterized protein n=1 Tax=Aspergillus carbonarius (strain ITEM 5010) TaxID=602072 RepID=A0A1R3RA78_ASPC5|nr:hypothetical protein ASPCADRAFT_409401 [Aspergillus carbonarius ITEM 5010]
MQTAPHLKSEKQPNILLPPSKYYAMKSFWFLIYIPSSTTLYLPKAKYGSAREGQVPALLETYRLPFKVSDTATVALCLDKGRTKVDLEHFNIPTAQFVVFYSSDTDNKTQSISIVRKASRWRVVERYHGQQQNQGHRRRISRGQFSSCFQPLSTRRSYGDMSAWTRIQGKSKSTDDWDEKIDEGKAWTVLRCRNDRRVGIRMDDSSGSPVAHIMELPMIAGYNDGSFGELIERMLNSALKGRRDGIFS